MNITLRQLKVFEAVARRGHISRAAQDLHLTQPAVSMQVKALEAQAGLPLLEIVGKKLHLTEAGLEMQRLALSVMGQMAEAAQVFADMRGLEGGRLHVAVASTVNYFATKLLAGFAQRHPGVHVNLTVNNRRALLKLLEGNRCDIVLMGQPPPEADVEAAPFMDNPLVVIAPPGHPLARRRGPLGQRELAGETFLMREPGSGTRSAMERCFAECGLRMESRMEMNTNEAIKQGVESGLGLGVVSLHTAREELAAGRLVMLDVEGFPVVRKWYVVHRRGKRLSQAAAAFSEFVLREATALDRAAQAAPAAARRLRKTAAPG
jgi:DNA-binding transcriptional LysR family regulator